MKALLIQLLVVLGLLIVTKAEAATTATSTVTYTIGSINAISVSGNPGTLTINSATAGSSPVAATDATTTYSVTTNNTPIKVYGQVATAMPSGTTLTITLVSPSGGTSAGAVAMTTSQAALVTGIGNIAASSLTITYSLTATLSASQVSAATNTVTFTIGT